MEFLQQKLAQVKKSWGQLSTSGRMALTLMVLLVVALLVIVSQYTGSPEMVPLPSTFQPEELGKAVAALKGQDIKAEARGGQIFVEAKDRNLALGMLAYSDAMPQSGLSYEQMFDGSSGIFEPETDKVRKARYLLKRELEDCLAKMPGIQKVAVNINFGSNNTIRTTPEGVSASISVQTKNGTELDKRTARAMASLVAGPVHGLSVNNIKVVDVSQRRTFDLSAESARYSDDYVQLVATYSESFENRLLKQFDGITGLRVGVHVVPDLDRVREQTHTVDPNMALSPEEEKMKSESTGSAASGGVGVVPNVGEGGGGATGGSRDSRSETRTGVPLDYGRTDKFKEVTPGAVKEITAAISVPHSYLEKIARVGQPAPAEGEEVKPVETAAIEQAFATVKDRIVKQATKIIGTKSDADVVVDWHYDFDPGLAALAAAAEGPSMLSMLQQYGPTVGLALFACLALFMVYNVVRRFTPAEVPADVPAPATAGEAGLTLDSILEGVELEAETIRASKMQEQISNMVKEDPEAVANLIKRWVVKE
jgi:flagellar M-ring protein FliF